MGASADKSLPTVNPTEYFIVLVTYTKSKALRHTPRASRFHLFQRHLSSLKFHTLSRMQFYIATPQTDQKASAPSKHSDHILSVSNPKPKQSDRDPIRSQGRRGRKGENSFQLSLALKAE